MRAILHTTIRCCFATHSFTIALQSHVFFKFLLLLPYAHYIIYLGTFSATFIRHPVFVFLLEISVENRQIHSPSTTINPSLFLVPATYLPIISSSPMFPSPTYSFRSAPSTIIFCFNTLLSTHPGFAKNHFSPPCSCQPVDNTRLLYLE